MKKKIKVKYDGKYPNLCRGDLEVIVVDVTYVFPSYCLSSGGSVSFDEKWNADISEGYWEITDWPENFPEELKEDVLEAVNDSIPQGCCGGCI